MRKLGKDLREGDIVRCIISQKEPFGTIERFEPYNGKALTNCRVAYLTGTKVGHVFHNDELYTLQVYDND